MKYDSGYNERLLNYITEYVRKEGVPPTVDMMIENVEGKSSKSTVFIRLKQLVEEGYLVQKNIKGYYYPTSILREVSVPKELLEEVCKELIITGNTGLVKQIKNYL